MSSTQREVVFILKATPDASLAEEFRKVGVLAKEAQDRITAEASKGAQARARIAQQEQKRLSREEEREVQDSIKRAKQKENALQRSYQQQARAREQEQKRLAIEEEREVQDSIKRAKQKENALQRSYQQQAAAAQSASRQNETLQREAERSAERFGHHVRRLIAGGHSLIHGSMQVARGLALLFASNSKDAQKLLEKLVVIEGIYGTMRGVSNLVSGITRAWRAYTTAVEAAAVAQAALAAAQTASAGTGAAGAGADASTAVNAGRRGLVGGLVGGFLGTKAAAGIAAAGAPVAAGAAAAGGVGFAGFSTFKTAQQVGRHGFMGGADPGSFVDRVGGSDWNPFSWMMAPGLKWNARSAAARSGEMGGRFISGANAREEALQEARQRGNENIESEANIIRRSRQTLPEAAKGVKSARAEVAQARRQDESAKNTAGAYEQQARAAAELETALQKVTMNLENQKKVTEEYNREVMEGQKRQIDAVKQHMARMEALAKEHAQREKELRKQANDALLGLAMKSPLEQQHVMRSLERINAGQGNKRDYETALPFMTGAKKEATEKEAISKLLTPEQRARYDELTGSTDEIETEKRKKESAKKSANEDRTEIGKLTSKATLMGSELKKGVDEIDKTLQMYVEELVRLRASLRQGQEQANRAMKGLAE